MNNTEKIKKELRRDWSIQGFSAVPIFLTTAAWSGMLMKKVLGFGYFEFIFNYKNGYGEMFYLKADFRRLWRIIKKKMESDTSYLYKIKKLYQKIFSKYLKLFKQIDQFDLSIVDNGKLLNLLKLTQQAETEAVGIAHIVDAIGIEIENDFKKELSHYVVNEKQFNNYFSILTSPTKKSFIAKEEEALTKIAKLPSTLKKKELLKHTKKFSWIQNGYAGCQKVTVKSLEIRLKKIVADQRKINSTRRLISKKSIFKKIGLGRDLIKIIETVDFITIWQDERKVNVLKSVQYLDLVLEEIAKRLSMPRVLLNYLSGEVQELSSLNEIKNFSKILAERKNGIFTLLRSDCEYSVTGKQYQALSAWYNKKTKATVAGLSSEIHGTIANGGTAVGRVVVCVDLKSLSKVNIGDIVVTSMTRPEFLPALKKAIAVITDEGGITCHAAIIARELNIPAVIGTKVATKILKDGMVVEIRANHGLIRVLKK